jgi:hypothetical protein
MPNGQSSRFAEGAKNRFRKFVRSTVVIAIVSYSLGAVTALHVEVICSVARTLLQTERLKGGIDVLKMNIE